MKTFYTDYNNGVQVLISEEVMMDIRKKNAISLFYREAEREKSGKGFAQIADDAVPLVGTPTFTFTRRERVQDQPWFTGDNDFLEVLVAHIRENGGHIVKGGIYVPFSNGSELGMQGTEAMARELVYVTSEQQFRDTFGISIAELLEIANDSLSQDWYKSKGGTYEAV